MISYHDRYHKIQYDTKSYHIQYDIIQYILYNYMMLYNLTFNRNTIIILEHNILLYHMYRSVLVNRAKYNAVFKLQ